MSSAFADILTRLEALMQERKAADPATSYVARLYGRGRGKIAQKLGEEAVETVIAAMRDDKAEIVCESADLVFHWLVLLADAGISLDEVAAELARREGLSGIDEKTARKES
jgi:phosphoribosyl-ATP pyrophosphohydrolase